MVSVSAQIQLAYLGLSGIPKYSLLSLAKSDQHGTQSSPTSMTAQQAQTTSYFTKNTIFIRTPSNPTPTSPSSTTSIIPTQIVIGVVVAVVAVVGLTIIGAEKRRRRMQTNKVGGRHLDESGETPVVMVGQMEIRPKNFKHDEVEMNDFPID